MKNIPASGSGDVSSAAAPLAVARSPNVPEQNDDTFKQETDDDTTVNGGPTAIEEPNSKRVKVDGYWGEYVGDLNSDGEPHGKGEFTWHSLAGSVYVGEFKNGMMHGKGKITMGDDGRVYEGEWKNDNYHGNGKFMWTDGEMYEGDWENHKLHGNGKYTWADGRVFEGDFINNFMNGEGKLMYPDGKVFEGHWKNYFRDGKGKYTWPSGCL
jgi:hypothetical protein